MPSHQSPATVEVEAEADRLRHALQLLHYLSPVAVFAYYMIATTVSVFTLQNLKVSITGPRKFVLWFMSLVLLSYVLEACMLLTDTLANGGRFSSTDTNIFALSNVLVWTLLIVSLVGSKKPVWHTQCGSWAIALLAETLLFPFGLGHGLPKGAFVIVRMALQACRMLFLVALPLILLSERLGATVVPDEESAPLLGQTNAVTDDAQTSKGSPQYGSIAKMPTEANLDYEAMQQKKDEEDQQRLEKGLQDSGNWFKYIGRFSIFLPLLWPSQSRLVHLNVVGVGICILFTRVLNVLQPRQLGILLDSLDLSHGHVPILEFLLYLLYIWLSESVVSPVRRLLWIPVELSAQASIKTAAYNQIMSLSRDFHTEKQSGEVYKSIDQGRSITGLLEVVAFHILPLFTDIVVAFLYLYYVFGPYMALTVAATTATYLWASTYFINKQAEPRRRSRGIQQKEAQLMYDTVAGWSSVSYFNRQAYEKGRYAAAADLTMLWERKVDYLFYYAWFVQDIVLELGLIMAGILAIYQIAGGSQKVGSFAFLMTYWGSFTGELGTFAYSQSRIRHSLVDAESLLELLKKTPTVKDGPNCFTFKSGAIHFQAVGFSYDGKAETIKDFNFHVAPGQRIALVGETGGGKSTILKLLFRFYDVQEGKIEIDGQDIKDVTLNSLRECIGVVPQDPVLFNKSVMENVRYARLGATDEEVMEACKGAAIHDKILTFSDGYQTTVGENGVKLSGGELQRIAIARVILKSSEIVLLDEATSAVDTETEAHIQEALEKLTKGRTTITIAHRLSTVTNADVIVVIKGGRIIEQGSPHALLEAKGKFSELWLKQIGICPTPKDEKLEDGGPGKKDPCEDEPIKRSDSPKAAENGTFTRSSEASSSAKSLRPTAPEFVPRKDFVPRHQRDTAPKGAQISHDQDALGYQHNQDGSTAKANGGTPKPQQKRKILNDRTSDAIDSDSQWETTGVDGAKPRRKRLHPAQRRRNNQTDPSDSISGPTQAEEPSDAPVSVASGEKAPMRPQSRRVSAPGGPLSNVTNAGGAGSKQRRRAQRWHPKKRGTSALGSLNTSGEASNAGSSDTLHPPTPPVRLPKPAEGDAPIKKPNTTGQENGSVHFRPGL